MSIKAILYAVGNNLVLELSKILLESVHVNEQHTYSQKKEEMQRKKRD